MSKKSTHLIAALVAVLSLSSGGHTMDTLKQQPSPKTARPLPTPPQHNSSVENKKETVSLEAMFKDLCQSMPDRAWDKNQPIFSGRTTLFKNITKEAAEANGLDHVAKEFLLNLSQEHGIDDFLLDSINYYNTSIRNNPFIGASLACQRYGGGDVFAFNNKTVEWDNILVKLFDYTTPSGAAIPVTMYSMLTTILKNADIMHKQGITERGFPETYARLKEQLEQDHITFAKHAFQTQVEGYFQEGGLDPKIAVTLLLEFAHEGGIQKEVLLERLQEMYDAKTHLKAGN